MKNVIFALFLINCLQAVGQDYLQLANNCFEKGDYECAKKNYTLFQTLDGTNMSTQIQKTDECLRTLNLADDYFKEREYEKARDRYKIVLTNNPKDLYAQKQYNECEKLSQSDTTTSASTPKQATQPNVQNSQLHPVILDMVFVEGGTFLMGSPQKSGYKNARPKHIVDVSSFSIGKYEVTQGQWKAIMGSNLSKKNYGDNYPVENVNWDDVQVFIKKLNEITGEKYRLPTEAEWEYAARGGNKNQGYIYSGSNNIYDVAWFNLSEGEIMPVGAKQPNELGIYDMSGNVWEWCNDWYGKYSSSILNNPKGPSSGNKRVIRGGSTYSAGWCSRVHYRTSSEPSRRNGQVGFRLALSQ